MTRKYNSLSFGIVFIQEEQTNIIYTCVCVRVCEYVYICI